MLPSNAFVSRMSKGTTMLGDNMLTGANWFSYSRQAKASWYALILLLILFGTSGYLVYVFALPHYQASSGFPYRESISFFRGVEPLLRSEARLHAFAESWPESRQEFDVLSVLQRQLANSAGQPVTIEYTTRITRRDLRDVPDNVAKQISPEDEFPSFIRVTVIGADREVTTRLAALAVEFARDTLLYAHVSKLIRAWSIDAIEEEARISSSKIAIQSDIQSLSNKLDALEKVRTKYQEINPSPASQSVQVQVQGAKHLSPVQQVVGIESELVEKREALQLLEQRLVLKRTLIHFANGLREPPSKDSGRGYYARMEKAFELLKSQRIGDAASNLSVAGALREVELGLASLRSRYLDTYFTPQLERSGFRAGTATVTGVGIGFVVWFGLLLLGILPRLDGAREK